MSEDMGREGGEIKSRNFFRVAAESLMDAVHESRVRESGRYSGALRGACVLIESEPPLYFFDCASDLSQNRFSLLGPML